MIGLIIECWGACDVAYEDELDRWPELPQTAAAAVAHVIEHGCPECGSLDVEAEAGGDDDGGPSLGR